MIMKQLNLYKYIDTINDFPKKGIVFRDISPLLLNYKALSCLKKLFTDEAKKHKPDYIIGIDARGFLFCTLLSQSLGIGSIMLRKSNKLPGSTIQQKYDLEYGSSSLSIQTNKIIKGKKIILIDDILATGGTLACAEKLILKLKGYVVLSMVVIELKSLNGRKKIFSDCFSALNYD